jgi:thymidylate synthase
MSTSLTPLSSSQTPKALSVPKFSPTSTAYLTALLHVLSCGSVISPRGKPTFEVEDYHFRVDHPDSRPITTYDTERNKVIAEYTAKELALYRGMSNKVADFITASKVWESLANPDWTINSAYGYLIWCERSCGDPYWSCLGVDYKDCQLITPWEWAKQALIRDSGTRQAFLRFSLPKHQWFCKDQVCSMHGLFLIRNEQLNFSMVMRSNDLVKGLVYDMPFFVSLMEQMVEELKPTYPWLRVGQYRHLAHSLHIYDVDVPKVKAMLAI